MIESVETKAMNKFKDRIRSIINDSQEFGGQVITFDEFVNSAIEGRKKTGLLIDRFPKKGLLVSAKVINAENAALKECWQYVGTVNSGNGENGTYSSVKLNKDADIHGIANAIRNMANAKHITNSCFFYAGSKKILIGLSTEVSGMSKAVQKAEDCNDKKEDLDDAIKDHNEDVQKLDEETKELSNDIEEHNEKVEKNEKAIENAKTEKDVEKAQKEQEKLKQEAEDLEKQKQEIEKQKQEIEKQKQDLEKQKKQVEQEQKAAQAQLDKTNVPKKIVTVEPITTPIEQPKETPPPPLAPPPPPGAPLSVEEQLKKVNKERRDAIDEELKSRPKGTKLLRVIEQGERIQIQEPNKKPDWLNIVDLIRDKKNAEETKKNLEKMKEANKFNKKEFFELMNAAIQQAVFVEKVGLKDEIITTLQNLSDKQAKNFKDGVLPSTVSKSVAEEAIRKGENPAKAVTEELVKRMKEHIEVASRGKSAFLGLKAMFN